MANPTTNFGWVMPTSASLVTNLPADFNTFGQAVDTSMAQLKGGSTGQVLSKTSATDMAFTWVTPTDQTPLTTKGDLFTFTTVDARLAVGNNGETLVADSSTSTGLRYNGNYAAGKNKIINGDFGVWQRGTSFSITGQAYLVDRWLWTGGGSGATRTLTQQTFTPGTAPVAGYEGTYFARYTQSVAGTGSTYNQFQTRLEDVRLFAGQTATISFWAKADATRSLDLYIGQNFGSGGSGAVETAFTGSPVSLTTSWARYTATVTVPSVSGKTIGTGSYLYFYFGMPNNVVQTIDYWGVQLEQGSVASAFNTATGTVQGELAACQRYYWRSTASAAYPYALLGNSSGIGTGANTVSMNLFHPVTMRTNPTAVEYGGTFYVLDGTGGGTGVTLAINVANTFSTNVTATKTGAFTQYRPYFLQAWGDAAAYVGLTAEL